MKDYFSEIYQYVSQNYIVNEFEESHCSKNIDMLLGYNISEATRKIYSSYEKFELVWFKDDNYLGEIHFVPVSQLENEHNKFLRTVRDYYDVEEDTLGIADKINNWYPLFNFYSMDAFCLDITNGHIVLFDHEILYGEGTLNGLKIANSIDELLERWSMVHFADAYYWDEAVNQDGLDLESDLLKSYL